MATLTVEESARIAWVIGYLEAGSAGRPLDGKAAEELARVFSGTCGFTCGCPGAFMDGLRDSPFSTLLTALLCVDGGVGLTAAQTARIQSVIDYLVAGSAGKHIDDTSVEQLARVFCGSCGFTAGCPGTFQEGMRDAPFSTLLRLILCIQVGGPLALSGITLAQANVLGGITIGDLIFADFSAAGGALTNDNVFITTLLDPACVGISFTGLFVDSGGGAGTDYHLRYSVRTISGLPLITSIHQSFTFGGNGFVTITEAVWDGGFGLGNLDALSTVSSSPIDFEDPPGEAFEGDQLLINPAEEKVWVQKDILLIAEAGAQVNATSINQRVCQEAE